MELSRRQVLGAASVAAAGAFVAATGSAAMAATPRRIGTTVSSPAILGGGPFGHPFYVAYAGGGGYGGATPNRRINVARGNDPERPTTMQETSGDAVGLAWNSAGGRKYISLAWAGDDRIRRLNFATSWDGVNFQRTATLDHTSLGGVALTRHDDRVMVAWTGGGGLGGGAPDGRINVGEVGGAPVILPWRSTSAPGLAGDPGLSWPDGRPRLYVAWTDAEGYIFLTYCGYRDLGELRDPSRVRRIETNGTLERASRSPTLAFSGNCLYLAWPGVDGARRINFKIVAGVGAGKKTTVGETASSAVAMQSYDRGASGWTGRYAYRGTDGVGGVYLTDSMPI